MVEGASVLRRPSRRSGFRGFVRGLPGFSWRLLPRWLQQRLRRVGRYFARRFADVSRSEASGYLVWSAFGVVVAVPELWAAIGGDGFWWPTISSTVGHLEEQWAVVAIVPVALLAASAYTLARYEPGLVVQAGDQALRRTREGRLARLGEVSPEQLPELALSARARSAGRRRWRLLPYFIFATVVVVGGSWLASRSENKWLLGYVLYSLIAVFWMLLPNWLAYRHRTDVPFTTLFFTLRCLRRRLQFVALALVAGLAILMVHLAIYPWPDLARESAGYAGLTPSKAREKATSEVQKQLPTQPLQFSAQSRGINAGRKAWFVYFLTADGGKSCVVLVTQGSARVSQPCPSAG
jgi:hypothetical protein